MREFKIHTYKYIHVVIVFDMTRSEIKPQSPGPLANTQAIMQMASAVKHHISTYYIIL